MEPPASENPIEEDRPQNPIGQHFFMLNVRRSMYRGLHTIDGLKTMVKGRDVTDADIVSEGKALMMPKPWLKRFGELFSKVTRILNRSTTPLRMTDATDDEEEGGTTPVLQMRILPRRVSNDVFGQLSDLRREIEDAAIHLQSVWRTDVIEWNRNNWVPLIGEEDYDLKIRPKLPSMESLRRRFRLSWGLFQVSEAAISSIDARTMHEEVVRATRNAREQIDTALASMLETPRRQLAEASARLQERLQSAQRVSPETFTEINDAIALVRSFADVGDNELVRRATALQQSVDAMVQRGTSRREGETFQSAIRPLRAALNAAATAVTQQALDPAAMSVVRDRMGLNRRGFGE